MLSFLHTLLAHPIIPAFLVANLAIGFWAHRKAKVNSFEDYALASRSLPTGVLVMTLLGTVIARGDINTPNSIFRDGVIDGVTLTFLLLSFFIIGTFLAPNLVYFRSAITTGDVMKELYGEVSQVVTGLFSCIYSLLLISSNLKAIGIVGSYLLDLDHTHAIILFGAVIIIYSVWGGMRSVSYTDILQMITALTVLVLITKISLGKIGGVKSLWEGLHEDKLKVLSHPKFYLKIKSGIFWGLSPIWLLTPPYFQRMLTTQNKRQVRKMWYVGALIYGIVLLMLVFIGLSAIVSNETLGVDIDRKNVLLSMIRALFVKNSWMVDLIFIGLLAILLSTIDSYLHALGISFSQDLLNPVRRLIGKKRLGDRAILMYTKGAMLIGGATTIALVLVGGKLLENQSLYKFRVLLTGMIIFPLIIGVLGVRTDKASFASFCIVFFISNIGLRYAGWRLYDHYLIGFIAALGAYFLTHIIQNTAASSR